MCGSCTVQHPYMPAHTRVCRCRPGIQAEQWPQRSQQMIKAPVCPCFVFRASLFVSSLLADVFYPPPCLSERHLRMWVAGESSYSGVVWVRPLLHVILPGWTNSTGQEEEEWGGEDWGERSGDCCALPLQQAGWPRRQGYRGSPFCFVPSEWGQLLLSVGLCSPSGEAVQDPPSPPSLTLSHKTTVTHSHLPVHPSPALDQLGVCSVL